VDNPVPKALLAFSKRSTNILRECHGFSCIPANLANRYQAVKQAIEKANLEYVEVIKARRESQEKQQAEQRLTEEQKEKSAEQARREFGELEL
jgi:hypothetical protein